MVIHFKLRVNGFKFLRNTSECIIQNLSLSTLLYNKGNFNANKSIFLNKSNEKYVSKLLI